MVLLNVCLPVLLSSSHYELVKFIFLSINSTYFFFFFFAEKYILCPFKWDILNFIAINTWQDIKCRIRCVKFSGRFWLNVQSWVKDLHLWYLKILPKLHVPQGECNLKESSYILSIVNLQLLALSRWTSFKFCRCQVSQALLIPRGANIYICYL